MHIHVKLLHIPGKLNIFINDYLYISNPFAFKSVLSDINIDALPTLAWDLCYISIVLLLLSGFQHLYFLDKLQVNGI